MNAESLFIVHCPSALTDAQRDGRTCVKCGIDTAPLRPLGILDGVQVFICTACPVEPADDRALESIAAGMTQMAGDLDAHPETREALQVAADAVRLLARALRLGNAEVIEGVETHTRAALTLAGAMLDAVERATDQQ